MKIFFIRIIHTLTIAAVLLTGGFLLSSIVYDWRHGPDYGDAYNELSSSTVRLFVANRGYGSSSVMLGKSGEKYLITNAHVCGLSPNGKIMAEIPLGESTITMPASIMAVSLLHDLCAVRLAGNFMTPLTMAKDYAIADKVFAIGFPTLPILSVAEGHITGMFRFQMRTQLPVAMCIGPNREIVIDMENLPAAPECIMSGDFISTTIPMDQGGSGSPMVNTNLEVVGVVAACMGQHVAGVIPLEYLQEFLDEL